MRDTPNHRTLGFWETLCEIVHDTQGGTGMILQVARVRGALTPELLRAALGCLERRHPMLRARIDGSNPKRSHFLFDEAVVTPLKVTPRDHGEQWTTVAEQELLRRFEAGSERLWRACFLHAAGTAESELVLTFHHAIADGLSTARFVHELLTCCARLTAGEDPAAGREALPSLPPVEEMLDRRPSWVGYLIRQVATMLLQPRMTPLAFDTDAALGERRTRHIYRRLERLDALAVRCRQERTTVNGALNAALVRTVARRHGGASSVVANNPAINLRRRCEPAVGEEHLGCFVSVVTLSHRVHAAADFWDLARESDAGIRRAARRQAVMPNRFHKPLLARALGGVHDGANRQGRFSLGCGVSNLGKLGYPRDYGPFHLADSYFSTARHAGDFYLYLNVVSLGETMFCCLAYEEPLVSEAVATTHMDEIVAELERAGG